MVPGTQRADKAMRKTIISYASASVIHGELPPGLTNELLVVGNQTFYLRSQFAWAKKVQTDIEFAAAPLYLFFDVLQTKTHLFPPDVYFQQTYYTGKRKRFIGKKSYKLEHLSKIWYGNGGVKVYLGKGKKL
jgi:hypothetical protein